MVSSYTCVMNTYGREERVRPEPACCCRRSQARCPGSYLQQVSTQPCKQGRNYCPAQQEVWRQGGFWVSDIQQLNHIIQGPAAHPPCAAWNWPDLRDIRNASCCPTRSEKSSVREGTVSSLFIVLRRKTPF